ncbi:hypothetical protein OHR68_03655 [Spirillospora sp. NBC_00431]
MTVTGAPREPPRSAYLAQVEQIFFGELKDRDEELAELADFCIRGDGPGYVWWQGPAWAGKSALMATLALNPPDGARVVPFFITARWAGQSDRTAFLEAMLEQLAEIVGQPLRDVLTESNRQQWFLRLLEEAAQACAVDGQVLVLLVDGLDEDRGVTRGPDAHSIAALLPGKPPEGVKVVVAGRPNPPIPADVPGRHPLRDRQIIRRLKPSPHAVTMRDDAERELDDLLDGGDPGRQLLGLLVVAGGGLTGRDLAELTDQPVRDIETVLHMVTGRSFASRAPQWVPGGERLFALAHEELVHSVQRALRRNEISDHKVKIHDWAKLYQQRGWPENTPEYLLRGYLQMLLADGDVPRMRELTTDWARLDRMLDLSRGDATALADITTVQEHIRDNPGPDITASLHLALTRRHLTRRNSNIPAGLPAVWIRMGNPNRAEALMHSIPDPSDRVRALSEMVRALVDSEEVSRARQLVADAESTARAITDPDDRMRALATVVGGLVAVGEPARARQAAVDAESIARSATELSRRRDALAGVAVGALVKAGESDRARQVAADAGATALTIFNSPSYKGPPMGPAVDSLMAAGEPDKAEAFARSLSEPSATALAAVANGLAKAGKADRARQAAADAEAAARSTDDTNELALVVGALVAVGEMERARQAAADVESATRSMTKPDQSYYLVGNVVDALLAIKEPGRAASIARACPQPDIRVDALVAVVGGLLAAGDLDRAESAARSIPEPSGKSKALIRLAEGSVAAGDLDRARQAAADAESTARSITDLHGQVLASAGLADAVVAAGEPDRARRAVADAETAARSITDPRGQAEALVSVVGAWAAVDELDRARQAAADAESTACTAVLAVDRANALRRLVIQLVAIGEFDRAESAAWSVPESLWRSKDLAHVVEGLVAAGELDRAEATARTISHPWGIMDALPPLVDALVAAGELDRAEETAHSIADPHDYYWELALPPLADAFVANGELDRAEAAARSISDPCWYADKMVNVIIALIINGDSGRARQLAADVESTVHSSTDPERQELALSRVAGGLAAIGRLDRAEEIVRTISEPYWQAVALSKVVDALVAVGELDRAESIARSFTDLEWQPKVLSGVVEALVTAGELDRAERAARLIVYEQSRATALAGVVQGLVDAKRLDRAESIVSSITDTEALASALESLFAELGTARSQRILVAALVAADPIGLLKVVAMVAPQAVLETAQHINHP